MYFSAAFWNSELYYIKLYMDALFRREELDLYVHVIDTFIFVTLALSSYTAFFSYLKLAVFDWKAVQNMWMRIDNICQNLDFQDSEYKYIMKMSIRLGILCYFCSSFILYCSFTIERPDDWYFSNTIPPFMFLSTAMAVEMFIFYTASMLSLNNSTKKYCWYLFAKYQLR